MTTTSAAVLASLRAHDTAPDDSYAFILAIFSTLLPGLLLIITLVRDTWAEVDQPKPLRNFVHAVKRPFTNFLSLGDLDGPLGSPLSQSTPRTRLLFALAFVEASGWLACLVYGSTLSFTKFALQSLLASLAWGYVCLRTVSRPPVTVPGFSLAIASAYVLYFLIEFCYDVAHPSYRWVLDILYLVIPVLFVYVVGTLPLQSHFSTPNIAGSKSVGADTLLPRGQCQLLDLVVLFVCRTLIQSRDNANAQRYGCLATIAVFSPQEHIQQMSRIPHPTHSLLRFLLVSNSLDLILDILLELWTTFIGYVPPYGLQKILAALAEDPIDGRTKAYYWALVVFAANMSFAQKDLLQSWHTRRCYERTRGQMFCMLHWKSLKRRDIMAQVNNGDEEGNADLGKIVNLMQGDAYAVAQRFWEFSGLFTSPIRIIISLVFLYSILGWSALSGVCVVLVAYALNYPLATYNIKITRSSWKAKDRRMATVNELLQNIRFLKYYGWEWHWSRTAKDKREIELGWRVKENFVATAISFIWTWVPSATALVSFVFYTLVAKEKLTVARAFTAIALFQNLQGPLTSLPGQIFALLHAYVSMQRIEGFLGEEEVPNWASTLTGNAERGSNDEIGFSEATFEWQTPPSTGLSSQPMARFQLGPLDFKFPAGKLTLVSGPTGSGKTALLSALLGEMHCASGSVRLNKCQHEVAYCGQSPWLEHATIRDNIVYASVRGYDDARYQAVVEACALIPDLSILQAGDMTEIGEKGITLSGGQRARIALARALYSEAKVILLDDPLAAVDMHTAQHLVANVLSGPLAKDRTVVLVTHHISFCIPVASHILELSRGQVHRFGTIQELGELGVLEQIVENEDEPFTEESPEEHDSSTFENEADLPEKDASPEPTKKIPDGKLIEVEARAEGRVSLKTYLTYIKAAGVICWILTLLLMLSIRFINIGNQVFLARWGEAYSRNGFVSTLLFVKKAITVQSYPWDNFPPPTTNPLPWLLVYLYISLAGAFCVLAYISLGYYASIQASRSLFISLLERLARAPSRFFDVTPVGRLLNRFTTDMNTIDNALQNSARNCLSGIMDFVASFLVILVVVPAFAPFALLIAWMYIRLAPPYVQASRDLRRLESISLSPAFAGFDELLRGLTHVRAFGMEERYQNQFYLKVDKFQSFDHVYWLVNAWLRWRYDCLGSLVVFASTMFAIWSDVSEGSAAIVIVQAGIFAEASRQLVKVAAQLELDFNSVERVVEYLSVPQEAPGIVESHRPPPSWPSEDGSLRFEMLEVRYSVDLPAVLKRLTFTVNPREKIGVVGRTGSGKSTLALSLLRMIEASHGRIWLDGIDIATIGLEDLRSRVTIVSQDVSLFSGTIRSNIDPLGEHPTEKCIDVLERCHLAKVLGFNEKDNGSSLLDMPISGGSLSAGERQLVAIARAILRGTRRTNLIIMDEATSQIDSELDDQIQQTLRENLSQSIILTIAHRLKTIMDYDRILVLSDGEIIEFDTPTELINKPGGAFREMCKRSADWKLLRREIAASV